MKPQDCVVPAVESGAATRPRYFGNDFDAHPVAPLG